MAKRNAKTQYRSKCANCGKEFSHARATAKYCPGGKCRLQAHRMKQEKGGNTWDDLTEEGRAKAHFIYRMSAGLNEYIFGILQSEGAIKAEKEIEMMYRGMMSIHQQSQQYIEESWVVSGLWDK